MLWLRRAEFKTLKPRDYAALGFIASVGSVVAMVFFTRSFATASNYTVPVLIQKLQPLFAITLARTFLKETLPKRFALWATVAMLGAYLVSFGATNVFQGVSGQDLVPVLYALAAAAIWGSTTVLGRAVLGRPSFLFVTSARFAFGALFSLAIVAYLGLLGATEAALSVDLSAFLKMAYVSGLLALAIYYFGLKTTPASVATLCELTFPLSAIFVNWVFLDTPLSMAQLGGAALLFAAITELTIDRRAKKL